MIQVPIQRLIISLASPQQKEQLPSKVAGSLIRNCQVPKTDIQLGSDRSLGFSGTVFASSAAGRQMIKKTKLRDRKANPDIYGKIGRADTVRSWNRPMFEDLSCSLYCDRIMLGEPPIRTALICPYVAETAKFLASSSSSFDDDEEGSFMKKGNIGGITFDSVTKVLQQYQNLQPEDILIVVDGKNKNSDDDIQQEEQKSVSSSYYLGSINEDSLNQHFAISEIAEAVSWRFASNNNDEEEEDDPIEYVSCLFGGQQQHQQQQPLQDAETKAFLSALWCTHPEAAGEAVRRLNNNHTQNGAGKEQEKEELMKKMMKTQDVNSRSLFQFSMIRLKDERILEAGKNPRLLKALTPSVAPTGLRQRKDILDEKVEDKMTHDEKVRQAGRVLIQELVSMKESDEEDSLQ